MPSRPNRNPVRRQTSTLLFLQKDVISTFLGQSEDDNDRRIADRRVIISKVETAGLPLPILLGRGWLILPLHTKLAVDRTCLVLIAT